MSIIWDVDSIAKEARLRALEGRPQNVVQPMGVETAGFGHLSCCAVNNGPALPVGPCDCGFSPDPVEFDGYGMYAFDPAPALPAETHIWSVWTVDTAPSEWSAPEQDCA